VAGNGLSISLLDPYEKFSRFIAFIMTVFFLLAILLKLFHWNAFIKCLDSMIIFQSAPDKFIKISGFTIMLLEIFMAIGFLFRSIQVFSSFTAFLYLNLIIVMLHTTKNLMNVQELSFLPAFDLLPLFLLDLVNIILAIFSLFLFSIRNIKQKGIKQFVVSLVIYLFFILFFVTDNVFEKSHTGESTENFPRFEDFSDQLLISAETSVPFLIAFINLSNLTCALCATSIDEFLNFIATDSSFSNHLILITHPDSLYGERRVEGWANAVHLMNNYKFIPEKQARHLQLNNSCVLLFDSDKNLRIKIQFPFAVKKEMEKIKNLIYGRKMKDER